MPLSNLYVYRDTVGLAPRRLGVNVEIQYYADRTNLWDFLADSGAGILREFHPEKNFRLRPVTPGAWGVIRGRHDYEALRQRCVRDPANGGILWKNYSFSHPIEWLGIPDVIIAAVRDLGVEALISLGYATRQFPRPLVKDMTFDGIPDDNQIDWEAAVSAYDYYFAMIYHYAETFGVRRFTMHNEPEYLAHLFHMPMAPADGGANGWWDTAFFPNASPKDRALFVSCLSTQYGVLARIARDAADDAAKTLGLSHGKILLCGPVSHGMIDEFMEKSHGCFDICDAHVYSILWQQFDMVFEKLRTHASREGIPMSISEFNLVSGYTPVESSFLIYNNCLQMASMLLKVAGLHRTGNPDLDFAALYHFHFPATHRNFNNLIYGDMNTVDWSGSDAAARRPPSFEELQLRTPTAAYHMFKMVTRAVNGAARARVLAVGSASKIHSICRFLATEKEDGLYFICVNPGDEASDNVQTRIEKTGRPYHFAVVRECSKKRCDQVVRLLPLPETDKDYWDLIFSFPAHSVTQVILIPVNLTRIRKIKLTEQSYTPGTAAKGLKPLETTRLRAIAESDGNSVDVTSLCTIWTSSIPSSVCVYQTGLVQRLRGTEQAVITASIPAGPSASCTVN